MATKAGYLGAFYISQQKCLDFTASTHKVTVADPTGGELDFGYSDFSLECWAAIAATGDGLLIDKNGGLIGYRLDVASNKARFIIDDGMSDVSLSTSTSVNTDKWVHIVATRDGNVKCYTYLNGIFETSDTEDVDSISNGSDLLFGNASNENDRRIALVRIYNKCLSRAQASDLYSGNFPDALKGSLVGEWRFFEGGGTNLRDSSASGNDGTITSASWVAQMYDTETTEDVGDGDASTKVFALDYQNVDFENLTVIVSDALVASLTQQLGRDISITPKGNITFVTAPAVGDNIKATYRHYPVTLEAGGFTNWSFDVTCDMLDSTDFRTAGWREFTPGLKGWTGSAERHWIHEMMTDLMGNKAIVRFYLDNETAAANKYYTGWCKLSGFSPNNAVDTLLDQGLAMQGTYQLGTETA